MTFNYLDYAICKYYKVIYKKSMKKHFLGLNRSKINPLKRLELIQEIDYFYYENIEKIKLSKVSFLSYKKVFELP